MNKFFMRKEAGVPGVTEAPGAAQALPQATYNKVGQPSWWEKPYYTVQRAVSKLPRPVRAVASFAGGGVFGLPNPLSGSDVAPGRQVMFDPKNNPEAYHNDLHNMAKAREDLIRERFLPALYRHWDLEREISKNPWRSGKLTPYARRAKHRADMLNEQLFSAAKASYRIGQPGSLEAANTIEDIKYGTPEPQYYDDNYDR